MAGWYFVRTGALGNVSRCYAPDHSYSRSARVVVRGERGLQIGQVLAPCQPSAGGPDMRILRPATVEDELLASRLERRGREAMAACRQELERRGLSACLLDAEYSLDGRQLCFYFLGDPPGDGDDLMSELAALHSAQVELAEFGKLLTEGCGPDCGSEAAAGCRSSACAACSLVGACEKKTDR